MCEFWYDYVKPKYGAKAKLSYMNTGSFLVYIKTLSSNNDKRMQSIDSIETYTYGTNKDLVSEKEEIKCNNIIKQ